MGRKRTTQPSEIETKTIPELREPLRPTKDGGPVSPAADNLTKSTTRIHDEVSRRFRLVPALGHAWRWYDVPYRAVDLLFVRRRYWPKLPKKIRRLISSFQNTLYVFNTYDRAKIAKPIHSFEDLVVPEGESVTLPYFWLAEYYSPSHAEDFSRRIGSRKWRSSNPVGRDSPEDAVRQGRQSENSLVWQSIATLIQEGDGRVYPGAIKTHLPAPFLSIALDLLPLGSALTAVVARFELTDEASESLDRALQASYQPRLQVVNGRLNVRQRSAVAIETVQETREALHQAGRDWFARELPGLFAVEAKASHPALDLLFTQVFDPFEHSHPGSELRNFELALGLNNSPFTLIHAPEWKRIRVMDYRFETLNRVPRDSGLALVSKYSDALGRKNDFKHNGDARSAHGIMTELHDGAPGLITRFGLFELLRIKQVELAQARDRASRLHSRRPITSAKKLRSAVLKSSIDMATVTRDIEALAANQHRYEWGVPSLSHRDRHSDQWSKSRGGLLSEWAKRQARDALRLADLDRQLLSILDLASSLNASIEGIRSQRWSLVVALLSLLSSAAAVWLAYLALTASSVVGGR